MFQQFWWILSIRYTIKVKSKKSVASAIFNQFPIKASQINDKTFVSWILIWINFKATVYLRNKDSCEMLVTVNITCMMLLTSVYLSVSSGLPSTPNIKPVEIWLIFNLAYPFLIIIIAILHQVKSKQHIRGLLINQIYVGNQCWWRDQ